MKKRRRALLAAMAAGAIASGCHSGTKTPPTPYWMKIYAPAREAVGSRIVEFHKIHKRWPENSAEVLRDGPIRFKYRQYGTTVSSALTGGQVRVVLKSLTGKHAPIYAVDICGSGYDDMWIGD